MKHLYSIIKTFYIDIILKYFVVIKITSILFLYILAIGIMALLLSWTFFDLILSLAIEDYTIKCFKNIIEKVAEPIFKTSYQELPVQIGENKKILCSAYYRSHIINKEWMQNFIQGINWKQVILRNDFNLENIKFVVFEEYKEYIQNFKGTLNSVIDSYDKIKFHKEELREQLPKYIMDAFMIEQSLKDYCSDVTFIENLLNQIDWLEYVNSDDCQSCNYYEIKQFLHDRIAFLHNSPQNLHITEKYIRYFRNFFDISRADFINNSKIALISVMICIKLGLHLDIDKWIERWLKTKRIKNRPEEPYEEEMEMITSIIMLVISYYIK